MPATDRLIGVAFSKSLGIIIRIAWLRECATTGISCPLFQWAWNSPLYIYIYIYIFQFLFLHFSRFFPHFFSLYFTVILLIPEPLSFLPSRPTIQSKLPAFSFFFPLPRKTEYQTQLTTFLFSSSGTIHHFPAA